MRPLGEHRPWFDIATLRTSLRDESDSDWRCAFGVIFDTISVFDYDSCNMRIVVDTNVFLGACLTSGAANLVLAACLQGHFKPIIGNALFAEYEDVLGREAIFQKSRLNVQERNELFDIFLFGCEWVRVYYQWRPNLRDESDNHLIELAVAGNARCIVTRNVRDLTSGQLLFPHIAVITPEQLLGGFSP
jgi:putative PIN family toxin of toxin-antitoxin system